MAGSPACVALTGATGFVGRRVLARLLAGGHRVRVLARSPDGVADNRDARLTVVTGGLFDRASLNQLLAGADAVVHLVGIIMENRSKGQTFQRVHTLGTENLIAAAQRAGVRRWVQMSALGSRPNAASSYHRTKWDAEQAVRASGIAHTIFRPSIIHGPEGEFMQMVKGFWCGLFPPFVPFFGNEKSAGRLQPVWVEDVAHCFVEALDRDRSIGETYNLGGPDVFSWPGLYRACREHLPAARPKRIVGLPLWYVRLIAGKPGVPFNRDQVIMSQEDSVCRIDKAQAHFEREMARFEPTFAQYAASIP